MRELISFALSSNTLLVTREPDGIGVCVYRMMSASVTEKSLSRLLLKMAFRNAGMVLGPLHQLLSGRTVCFGKLGGGLGSRDCELRVLNLEIIGCVLVLILFLVLEFACVLVLVSFAVLEVSLTPRAGRESTRLRRSFDTSGLLTRVASARMLVSKASRVDRCVGAAQRITEC